MIWFDPEARVLHGPAGRLPVPPQQAAILGLLIVRAGALVSREAIERELWGDRPDGGPEDAAGAIGVLVCYLRRTLRQAGAAWQIETRHGAGYLLRRG